MTNSIIMECPNPECNQRLKIPTDRKLLRITCPRCREVFFYHRDLGKRQVFYTDFIAFLKYLEIEFQFVGNPLLNVVVTCDGCNTNVVAGILEYMVSNYYDNQMIGDLKKMLVDLDWFDWKQCPKCASPTCTIQPDLVVGPLFADLRAKLKAEGSIACMVCGDLVHVPIEKLIEKIISYRLTPLLPWEIMAKFDSKYELQVALFRDRDIVVLPNPDLGHFCKTCQAIICAECTKKEYDKVGGYTTATYLGNGPQCPRCFKNILCGIDHITD